MQETILPLPSGGNVVVLNLMVTEQRGRSGGMFSIQYRSTVPSSDVETRRAEAFEVISKYAAFAEEQGYSLSAQICNTDAAAETRELPERIFYFELGADRQWVYRYSVNAEGAHEA
jgi:hypothetical protein